jgi:hypothetical protein
MMTGKQRFSQKTLTLLLKIKQNLMKSNKVKKDKEVKSRIKQIIMLYRLLMLQEIILMLKVIQKNRGMI